MVSESKKRANRKWDAENMTRISCKVRKDVAEQFKQYAAEHNTTVNALVLSYVRNCLKEGDNNES